MSMTINQVPPNYNSPSPEDLSRHIRTLKARLGLASFKLQNGWEKNTLIDIELLWKREQRRSLETIPTPRFTQQDILEMCDRRARHKAASSRNLLPPGTRPPLGRPRKNRLARSLSSSGCQQQQQQQQQQQDQHDQHDQQEQQAQQQLSKRGRKKARKLSDDSQSTIHSQEEHPIYRPLDRGYSGNSLEALSYAIEMTEGDTSQSQPLPDTSRVEAHLSSPDDSRTHSSWSQGEDMETDNSSRVERKIADDETLNGSDSYRRSPSAPSRDDDSDESIEGPSESSPPSSPITAAAHAIMMFVNGYGQSKPASGYKA
ncbi:hypothetical protein BCR43DRAFT_486605 [Syncephalastrum racemosum]|uniref:Uncharacterized protein n=1 Tax=Syncephalastrum racemosum TaxID=13706 RepID=A0A1X2HPG2_SYNRA|nr:hypothetical protein BCR43DRAFT_486605 [Syncephalastrum racemosum]